MITDKLTRPLRDLRISVTDRCNFRCTYCMPSEIYGERYKFLPKADLLTFEEIARVTHMMVDFGAEKVRLTGGEPLIRTDIEDLVYQIAQIEGVQDLTMTTNGYLLPQKAQLLKQAGLQRITISLDTLDSKIFRSINGRGFDPKKVLDGVKAAEHAGFHPIKINSVVQRNVNDHTVVDLARYFKERGHIVRFIEYMDVGTLNGWKLDHVVPADEIVARINAEMPLESVPGNYLGEVALRYRYKDGDGEIGVISSVTNPFCGACTRLRLSPEGQIYTCLFSDIGTDLRTSMRAGASDEELKAIIAGTWGKRVDSYSEDRASLTEITKPRPKIEMYKIGG